MGKLLTAYCILFVYLVPKFSATLIETPTLKVALTESGFHRDLIYTTQFKTLPENQDCKYILEQKFPAAIYVSVDQLDDLKRLQKLDAIYPEIVDVEVSTENAEPFSVLLQGIPKETDEIKLPIHFRYHAPNAKKKFVKVHISDPVMYIKCSPHDLKVNDNIILTSEDSYCVNKQGQAIVKASPQVEPNKLEDCGWKVVEADYQLSSPLSAKIPVGDEKGFPPILVATIIVSWVVSLWTVYKSQSNPRNFYSLQAQRISSNKNK